MINIYFDRHTEFASRHLVNQLGKLGYKARITDRLNVNDKSLHLIYNGHNLGRMPPNYIIMNTEIGGSHWFNDKYFDKIKNAIAVWDYHEKNQPSYEHEKKSIVTPGIDPQNFKKKDIPLMFYGWIDGSERRRLILDELSKELKILIVTNILGKNMWRLLGRTKTVINVHYYDDSPPEMYRICEAISFGCKVWMYDEKEEITTYHDNLEELKEALKLIGI